MKRLLLLTTMLFSLVCHGQTYSEILLNKDTVVYEYVPGKPPTFDPGTSAFFSRTVKKYKAPVVTPPPVDTVVTPPPSVPSTIAQGFGSQAVGGSKSTAVYRVTNLEKSGPGSLANGIGSNRTILFNVSGTIIGRFNLAGISYLTIDASGQNITIDNDYNGDGISFDGTGCHHNILKGVHVRNAGNDGINVINGASNILITNCTSYDNQDGNIDVAGGTNVTVQYCIIGGGKPNWSGAMLVTARNVSVHHNLFSSLTDRGVGERNPHVHANYSPVGSPNIDFRNNIVWQWGRNNGEGSGYGASVAYGATGNLVNNYFYSQTNPGSAAQPDDGYGGNSGSAYIAGNVSGNANVNPNSKSNHAEYVISTLYKIAPQPACDAARDVLRNVGPSVRNSVDNSLINAVTLRGCPSPSPVPAARVSGKQSFLQWNDSIPTKSGKGKAKIEEPKVDTSAIPLMSYYDYQNFIRQHIGYYLLDAKGQPSEHVKGAFMKELSGKISNDAYEVVANAVDDFLIRSLEQFFNNAVQRLRQKGK
ncbi:MAG: right-handed parallel beta-helix repeat-containing protein [Chitinophagaceae bacterium]|nr:right-handed parallel beta-helix repeat-containing protein [Chitinophagaceae bacterium]